jgi:hypothetical protein
VSHRRNDKGIFASLTVFLLEQGVSQAHQPTAKSLETKPLKIIAKADAGYCSKQNVKAVKDICAVPFIADNPRKKVKSREIKCIGFLVRSVT